MSSSAEISTLVEGLAVSVVARGHLHIRALVTREALETHWNLTHPEPDSMLLAFRAHQEAIEAAILERYAIDRKQPVVVHATERDDGNECMKTFDLGLELECLTLFTSQDARQAFEYLIAYPVAIPSYTCYLERQGHFSAFRYKQGQQWPFGFIVNRKSLLFYFRKPGLKNGAADFESLTREFADVSRNRSGEIKVRISTEAEARRLMRLVFGRE